MDAFYFPGKLLGTEEEFIPGEGAYVEDGKVYSCSAGEATLGKDKRASIKSAVNTPTLIRSGMIVYGRVEEIFEPIALVRLEPIESANIRQSAMEFMSVLHISKIKDGYVRSVRDWVRIGDIVKAKVEDVRRGEVYLNIKDDNLGVIKAFCSKCRKQLNFTNKFLQCICGSRERRKLSSDYGTVKV